MQVSTQERPPQILQIYSETIKPGSEAAYTEIEEEITRICVELKCPHPYLGVESLTGSKEVWFFNGYESKTEQQKTLDDYSNNKRLLAALTEASKRKAALTHAPAEVFANYRPELTRGTPWRLGQGRFLVVNVGKSAAVMTGTVYESTDGARFIFNIASAREEADALANRMGSGARVFAVRPTWSTPAAEWVAADPAFWASYPPRTY